MSYRGISVVGENVATNQLYYSMDIPCQQLGAEDECKVHEDIEAKPIFCQRYPMKSDGTEKCSYKFQQFGPFGLK